MSSNTNRIFHYLINHLRIFNHSCILSDWFYNINNVCFLNSKISYTCRSHMWSIYIARHKNNRNTILPCIQKTSNCISSTTSCGNTNGTQTIFIFCICDCTHCTCLFMMITNWSLLQEVHPHYEHQGYVQRFPASESYSYDATDESHLVQSVAQCQQHLGSPQV